jgi:phage FluMu gp28-like protein
VIEFTNGSRVHFRSFDKPKFLRGLRRIGEVWVDEIQDIKEQDFWTVVRPLISDVRGTLVVSGQFRGLGCWYYKPFYEKGQAPGQNLYKSWKMHSKTGLAFQDADGQEELRLAEEQLTRAQFLQEYACEPVANQAAVFLTEDLLACTKGDTLNGPRDECRYIIGYDLGEMVDHSGLVVWEYETKTVVHAEQIPLRTKHETQAKRLAQVAAYWNGAQVVIDGTGGGAGGSKISDENVKFYRQFIPDVRVMVWTPSIKTELVRKLSLEIEQHKVSIPERLAILHRQLAAYEFKRRGEGYIYSAPEGQSAIHDDMVAALMMCAHAHSCQWVKGQGVRLGTVLG